MPKQSIGPTSTVQRRRSELMQVRTDVINGVVQGNKSGVRIYLPLPKNAGVEFCGVEFYQLALLNDSTAPGPIANPEEFALTLIDEDGNEVLGQMPLTRLTGTNASGGVQRTLYFRPCRIDFLRSYVQNFAGGQDGIVSLGLLYP